MYGRQPNLPPESERGGCLWMLGLTLMVLLLVSTSCMVSWWGVRTFLGIPGLEERVRTLEAR